MTVDKRIPLSAIDLLSLADIKKVARIDLATVGYGGLVYVCDLTTAQQQAIFRTPSKGSKVKRYDAERATEFDASLFFADAGAKFLEACLVTDKADGVLLEAAFEEAAVDGVEPEFVTYPAGELVYMAEQMLATLKQQRLVRERLDALPNAVTNEIAKVVRNISGMGDEVEEKKDNS